MRLGPQPAHFEGICIIDARCSHALLRKTWGVWPSGRRHTLEKKGEKMRAKRHVKQTQCAPLADPPPITASSLNDTDASENTRSRVVAMKDHIPLITHFHWSIRSTRCTLTF